MAEFKMSKETTLKGLRFLTEKGLIEVEYRKGYFVKSKVVDHTYRICMIFDKMNILRDQVYNSFLKRIHAFAEVDVFFHHHNVSVFERLVLENLNNYTHFVITTFFKESVTDILNRIPAGKRIIVDLNEQRLDGDYICIYQDYRSDLYESLNRLKTQLVKYKRLILIAHSEAFHGSEVIAGFEEFVSSEKMRYKLIEDLKDFQVRRFDAFITFSRYDTDDIEIIKLCRAENWQLGKDIGLLSYNDSAVKEVLEDGITVITTDFNKMGEDAADAIINKTPMHYREPARIILRNSL